ELILHAHPPMSKHCRGSSRRRPAGIRLVSARISETMRSRRATSMMVSPIRRRAAHPSLPSGRPTMLPRLLAVGVPALVSFVAVPARAGTFFFDFNNQSDAGLTLYDPLAAFGQGGTFSFPQLSPGNFGYQLAQAGVPVDNPAGPARLGSSVTGQTFSDVV